MFNAQRVLVTVLSTVRLKGKYIMQMSLLHNKTGKEVLHKAVSDGHCQNVLWELFSSPAACLKDYRTSPRDYGNVHFVLYKLRYAFVINHDITRYSRNNRIYGIRRVRTDT